MGSEVFFYVPNLIGYGRLVLIVTSWIVFYSQPHLSICLYISSVIGIAFTGCAARTLDQESAFSTWLDAAINVLGRGMLWCRLYHFGYAVACLEWLCLVSIHNKDTQWRNSSSEAPWFVVHTLKNGIRSAIGACAVAGLQGLPIWLYLHYHGILTKTLLLPFVIQYIGIGLLASARAIHMFVEVWIVWSHMKMLVNEDCPRASNQKKNFSFA